MVATIAAWSIYDQHLPVLLEGLGGFLCEGVWLGSFQPSKPIPLHVIFCLLKEVFPALYC